MTTATSTVHGQIATQGSTVCTNENLVARQPIRPLPFPAVAVWPVAPLIGYLGLRRRMAGEPFVLMPLVISSRWRSPRVWIKGVRDPAELNGGVPVPLPSWQPGTREQPAAWHRPCTTCGSRISLEVLHEE